MTLHPQARAAVADRSETAPSEASLAAARRELVDSTPLVCGPGVPVAAVRAVNAHGVPGTLYTPVLGRTLPVFVYLHGGGWTMGDAAAWDAPCRRIARVSGWAVLALDYRLAPEHPYPAAVRDVDAALGWLRESGRWFGLDGTRVAVGGDSAGAYLATVAAARARDRGSSVECQVLVYPALDPLMAYPSSTALEGYMLDRAEMAFFWSSFLGDDVDRTDPAVAPMRADLSGLPPTLVITAEYDILRDEGEAYAALLADAGVAVTATRYCGMVHGFFRRLARYDSAAAAADHVSGFLRARLPEHGLTPAPASVLSRPEFPER